MADEEKPAPVDPSKVEYKRHGWKEATKPGEEGDIITALALNEMEAGIALGKISYDKIINKFLEGDVFDSKYISPKIAGPGLSFDAKTGALSATTALEFSKDYRRIDDSMFNGGLSISATSGNGKPYIISLVMSNTLDYYGNSGPYFVLRDGDNIVSGIKIPMSTTPSDSLINTDNMVVLEPDAPEDTTNKRFGFIKDGKNILGITISDKFSNGGVLKHDSKLDIKK